jgi:hypothetical protein
VIFAAGWGLLVGSELRRTSLPRTLVNEGTRKRRRFSYPAPLRQREIDLENHSLRYSSLRWGCSRIGNILAVLLIAQAASCQGDKHNRQRPKADQNRHITAVVVYEGSGKEPI